MSRRSAARMAFVTGSLLAGVIVAALVIIGLRASATLARLSDELDAGRERDAATAELLGSIQALAADIRFAIDQNSEAIRLLNEATAAQDATLAEVQANQEELRQVSDEQEELRERTTAFLDIFERAQLQASEHERQQERLELSEPRSEDPAPPPDPPPGEPPSTAPPRPEDDDCTFRVAGVCLVES